MSQLPHVSDAIRRLIRHLNTNDGNVNFRTTRKSKIHPAWARERMDMKGMSQIEIGTTTTRCSGLGRNVVGYLAIAQSWTHRLCPEAANRMSAGIAIDLRMVYQCWNVFLHDESPSFAHPNWTKVALLLERDHEAVLSRAVNSVEYVGKAEKSL